MNVVPFPRANFNDIAAMARQFADDVDAGHFGKIKSVAVVVESSQGFITFGWGDCGDHYRMAGMFLSAAGQQPIEPVDEDEDAGDEG